MMRGFWARFIGTLRGPRAARLYCAGLALFLPIAVWFAGWITIGDALLPIRWGAYVAPWLALVLLIAALLLGLARRVGLAAVPALFAVLILLPILPRFSPARWSPVIGTADLRVMTFNASTLNADTAAVARLILEQNADIVFLQQVPNPPALEQALNAASPRSRPRAFVVGEDVMIVSRFALSAAATGHGRATAVASVGACRIRLWSLHAPHGQFSYLDQTNFFFQAAQAVADERLPVIAGGDLNSTEFNSVQTPLRQQLRDAYADAGWGPGFTFPSRMRRFGFFGSLFRIDHLFYRALPRPLAGWVVGDPHGSDHLPTVVVFSAHPC